MQGHSKYTHWMFLPLGKMGGRERLNGAKLGFILATRRR